MLRWWPVSGRWWVLRCCVPQYRHWLAALIDFLMIFQILFCFNLNLTRIRPSESKISFSRQEVCWLCKWEKSLWLDVQIEPIIAREEKQKLGKQADESRLQTQMALLIFAMLIQMHKYFNSNVTRWLKSRPLSAVVLWCLFGVSAAEVKLMTEHG